MTTFVLLLLTTNMRIILWIADLLGIVLSALWYIKEPGFEPIITGIATLGGLIALLITENKKPEKVEMKQKAGKKSKQYQSGGDMTINPE
jgi:hypothetical protein